MSKITKFAKHVKNNPNDSQSAARVTPPNAGKAHTKRSKFEASLSRAVAHDMAFGKNKKEE